MKRYRVLCFTFIMLIIANTIFTAFVFADTKGNEFESKSYILMESSTGEVLLEHNSKEKLPPASITKVMTMLLVYDAVEDGKLKWDDKVTVSEHASSMGGSQVYLEPGEVQTVEDLMKCIAIASANDAAVAMAEHIAGSEEGFIKLMNKKASELGMENTYFKNACGLHVEGHLSSAYDIAMLSRHFINSYPESKELLTTWMDTITHRTKRGESEFGLSNTNRLIKVYTGLTGLKTGYTSQSKHCITATANRDNMNLIAVVLGAPDSKTRFKEAASLLDIGFANYTVQSGHQKNDILGMVQVFKGDKEQVEYTIKDSINILVPKDKLNMKMEYRVSLNPKLIAPIMKNDIIGEIEYSIDGQRLGSKPLVAAFDVNKAGYGNILKYVILNYFTIEK